MFIRVDSERFVQWVRPLRVPLAWGVGVVLLLACQRQPPVVDDEVPSNGAYATATSGVARDPVAASLSNTRPEFELAKPHDYYRVDLDRTNGIVHLVSISRVTSRVRPLPSLALEYLLVARRGTAVASATPVSFPTTTEGLPLDSDGQPRGHVQFHVTEATASVLVEVDPTIDRLELTDPASGILLRIAASELPVASGSGAGGGADVAVTQQGLTLKDLRARYEHIKFLSHGDTTMVKPSLLQGGSLVDIPSAYLEILDDALAALAPAVVSSIQTIGVASIPKPANKRFSRYFGITSGPQIVLADDLDTTTLERDSLARNLRRPAANRRCHARQCQGRYLQLGSAGLCGAPH